ncbi:MAG: energy transducer TonB [Cytophagaceae bacterium]
MKRVFLILLLFSFALESEANYFLLKDPADKVLIYHSRSKQEYVYYLDSTVFIKGHAYIQGVHIVGSKSEKSFYRILKSNIVKYDRLLRREIIVMPEQPKLGNTWYRADKGWKCTVTDMNSNALDEKYEGLMEVEVLNEETNTIQYFYYAKDIGLVGVKSEKNVVSSLFKIYNGSGCSTPDSTSAIDSTANDKMASYPGGIEAFSKYVASNVSFTRNAILKGVEGMVFVRFTVCSDGKVSNVQVVKGIDPELDEQAALAVKASPDWIPGMKGNQAINIPLQIPIRFSLPEADTNQSKGKKSRR